MPTVVDYTAIILGEIGRDMIQLYNKKPLHKQEIPQKEVTAQKRHINFDYTTIWDRLVGVTTSTKLVCLDRFMWSQLSN